MHEAIATARGGVARPPAASSQRRHVREAAIELAVTLVALGGIAAVVLIFVFVGREALPVLTDADVRHVAGFGNLFTDRTVLADGTAVAMWQPVGEVPKFSMIPLFLGTLKVTAVALLLAVPIGIAAAVYTAEFAPRRVREALKPTVELLAGIPSVVLGFFGLMVLATWLQDTFGFAYRLNAVVAGVAMALAVVPVIYTVSEDALTAVPRSFREASLALGATRWETAWKVVLPAAAPGVLAAAVLGFGRCIGETMIVLMASGNAAITSWSLGDSVRTLSATIAAEMGEVVFGDAHYAVLFFIGVELFTFTFLLNGAAAWAVRRLVRRMSGARA